jgi:hypothetical protein
MLARLLGPQAGRFEIASTRLLPSEVQLRVCRDEPAVVFIAIIPPGGIIQARFLVRRLRKAAPDVKIVVGYFGRVRDFDRLLNKLRAAGANAVTTSVVQSYRQLQTILGIADATSSTHASSTASATSAGMT